jgi:hypothetical protein
MGSGERIYKSPGHHYRSAGPESTGRTEKMLEPGWWVCAVPGTAVRFPKVCTLWAPLLPHDKMRSLR